MKTFLALFLFVPVVAFANLDGVYHNKFQKNGYSCEFNADIFQNEHSLRIEKWKTNCVSENGPGSVIQVNGPMTFTFLNSKEVKVTSNDDVSIYKVKSGELSENAFYLNYEFESFLEGIVLKYDVLLDFKLKNKILNYTIRYLQNDQLIFSDAGVAIQKN